MSLKVTADLLNGKARSCGCRTTKHLHGGNGSKRIKPSATYTAWRSMRVRCTEPKVKSFRHYGGRGIKVCERWQKFENFLADMGERPSPKHSLDRIDVNGHYEPGNVRWATPTEQQGNRRTAHRLEYNGVIYSLAALSRLAGCGEEVLRWRLNAGWSIKEAVETSVRPKARQKSSYKATAPSTLATSKSPPS